MGIWEEIFTKLNLGLSEEELKHVSYQERCNLLNNNPLLGASHFRYKDKVSFKEIINDGPFDQIKYHALRIEIQERGSLHVHSYLYVFSMHRIFKMKLLTSGL